MNKKVVAGAVLFATYLFFQVGGANEALDLGVAHLDERQDRIEEAMQSFD